MTDRTWFSHLLRHLARKRSGSVLTTPEPARGGQQEGICRVYRLALPVSISDPVYFVLARVMYVWSISWLITS